jgi:hypothetical protein
MSTTVDDPALMPRARRPRWVPAPGGVGGVSEDPLFVLDAQRVAGAPASGAALAALGRAAAAAEEALRAAAASGDETGAQPALDALEAAVRELGAGHRALRARIDHGAHAIVEPAVPRPLGAYEHDLASTRPEWRQVRPPHATERP